jgi:hypothetical protein
MQVELEDSKGVIIGVILGVIKGVIRQNTTHKTKN